MKAKSQKPRGFVLLIVMVLMIILVFSLSYTLHEASQALREGAMTKKRQLVQNAVNAGIQAAMSCLQQIDPADMSSLVNAMALGNPGYDIFTNWGTAGDFPVGNPAPAAPGPLAPFVCPGVCVGGAPCAGYVGGQGFPYPPAGDYANELMVRTGMRPGQKTLAPAGEDAETSFGFVVEILVSVRMGGAASISYDHVEERMVVGVRLPHRSGS